MKIKYFKVCRVRCKLCGTVLEYVNRSKQDNGLGSALMCDCGKVGLDPSACLYRVLGDRENYEDLSELWEIADTLLDVEQDRAEGNTGCTVEELEAHLDKVIETDAQYYHGSYIRRGEPQSREEVRKKKLQDFLSTGDRQDVAQSLFGILPPDTDNK